MSLVGGLRRCGTPYVKVRWLRFVGAQPGQMDEAIGVTNLGGGAQDMTGWTVRSPARDKVARFPHGFVLQPGQRCYIYTGIVRDESCGGARFTATDVWPDDARTAVLFAEALALLADETLYAADPNNQPPPPNLQGMSLCARSTVEINQEGIEDLDASRKRQLTVDIVAIKTFALHRPDPRVVLFHLPTATQIIVDPAGNDVTRAVCDPGAERALEAVANDPALMEQALALIR